MDSNLFQGDLVRLSVENPLNEAEAFIRWNRDSEYHRLLDSDAYQPRSLKQAQAWFEERAEKQDPNDFLFMIRTLQEDRLIGFLALWGTQWNHGSCTASIGIGEREYWGKGYGSDAMRLGLAYAFSELNLSRVSLSVLDYNQRAIRSYQKVGFRREGTIRQYVLRDNQRWDVHHMGILRSEWLASQERAAV